MRIDAPFGPENSQCFVMLCDTGSFVHSNVDGSRASGLAFPATDQSSDLASHGLGRHEGVY